MISSSDGRIQRETLLSKASESSMTSYTVDARSATRGILSVNPHDPAISHAIASGRKELVGPSRRFSNFSDDVGRAHFSLTGDKRSSFAYRWQQSPVQGSVSKKR